MSNLSISTSTLPWIAALVLGGSAHVCWLAHELFVRGSPQVIVVPPPEPTACTQAPVPVTGAPEATLPEPTLPEPTLPEPTTTAPDAQPAAAAHAGVRPADKQAPNRLAGANEAIECPSDRHCFIDRAFFQRLLANPSLLARQARIVPSIREGEPQGYNVFGIRRDSLPKLLGLHNGDLVTAINGHALTSIEVSMQVYSTLRFDNEIEIGIVRKGQPFTLKVQPR